MHSIFWLKGGLGSAKPSLVSLMVVFAIMVDNSTNANIVVIRRFASNLHESF